MDESFGEGRLRLKNSNVTLVVQTVLASIRKLIEAA